MTRPLRTCTRETRSSTASTSLRCECQMESAWLARLPLACEMWFQWMAARLMQRRIESDMAHIIDARTKIPLLAEYDIA